MGSGRELPAAARCGDGRSPRGAVRAAGDGLAPPRTPADPVGDPPQARAGAAEQRLVGTSGLCPSVAARAAASRSSVR